MYIRICQNIGILLVAIIIVSALVGKENTPTDTKPNSLFPVEDYPHFEDAPVAEEKPFTEHTQSAKKKSSEWDIPSFVRKGKK